MPNGENISAERVVELSRMLTIIRSSMQKTEARCSELQDKLTAALREKDVVTASLRMMETTIRNTHIEQQFIYTEENHEATVKANSDLVDENERLRRQIGLLEVDNAKFKREAQQGTATAAKRSTDFMTDDGHVPGSCPCGGCKHYEQVLQSSDAIKAFQNHLNHTHRVCLIFITVFGITINRLSHPPTV